MARGTTLVRLLDNLRAEAGLSLNPAHNNQHRDIQVNLLQRTQERLWQDFTWPHLRVERQMPVVIGQRYYAPPDDLDIERITSVELFRDGGWVALSPAIGGAEYAVWNSDLGQQSWPPRAWRLAEDDQIEIWPISDIGQDTATLDGTLKIVGTRQLKPLVTDADRADLDDRLIVLFAAAELCARNKQPDAQLKLDAANRHYARLRAGLVKQTSFSMFGTGRVERPRRMIANYRPAGT
jgi:hypothetical protein